ncbi:MAG: DUF4924 family protein [Bacteroidales bacterium]|nr:DUF4924 family protein [Bacteroidales bacterium]
MIAAQRRRNENIIEYILYMWQVEDMIRANGFDMAKIDETIVSKYTNVDEDTRRQIHDWWDNLLTMMQVEKLEQKGHLKIIQMLMNDVYNYHLYLLTQPTEIPYQNAFQSAWADLSVFEKKIPGGDKMHHIELSITALYEYFLLKVQKKLILADTTNAIVRISRYLNILSNKYLAAEREMKKAAETNADGTLIKH